MRHGCNCNVCLCLFNRFQKLFFQINKIYRIVRLRSLAVRNFPIKFSMVVMKPEDVSKYEIGKRVDVSGQRGTIMYIGEVANTEGLWLGIDWDNPERGKHDGSVMGVRYFTASHPTSGSFVRPKNANTGITVLEGIEQRYGEIQDGTTGLDYEKIAEVQREMRAKVFEVVGAEQLNKHLSNFQNLRMVVLHGMLISSAGPPLELFRTCPNIRELHLGKTLLCSWKTVAEIVGQLKYLELLNVSSNRLKIEGLESEPFSSLRHVIIGNMNYTWDEVLTCFKYILSVETVQVPFNNIQELKEPPTNVFAHVSCVDLEGNLLKSWKEVNKLGGLKTLKSMNLRSCGLKEITFPTTPNSSVTYLFPSLESLALSNNLYDDWTHISELDKLQSLTDLKFKDNPVLDNEKMETNHQLIITRIRKLEKINGATILPEDRRGSEVDYLKRYGMEWLVIKTEEERLRFLERHPCYLRLIEKFGPPDINELRKPKTSLKSQLIQIEIFSPELNKSYLKKVPYTMSIQKLAGLAQRLFNTGCEIPRLTCIRSEGSKTFEVPIENDLKQLDFYSIRNGDKISVRW